MRPTLTPATLQRRAQSSPGPGVGAFARQVPTALALVLAGLAAVLAYRVAGHYFEFWPHLEDEVAYWWQAQAATRNQLTVPSPPEPERVLVPFVVDRASRRFGKYPPGWPVVLSLGMRAGRAAWVNPLLAGLAVFLLYRLGQRVADPAVGLLAAALALTSPFFWMHAGSLLAHMWAWVLTLACSLALLDVFWPRDAAPPWPWPATVAGLSLALLLLTRPWTALGVALPWLGPGLWALARGHGRRGALWAGLLAAGGAGLVLVWQAALTGHPWQSPYTLWWPYDRPGFGPGHGPLPEGHSLHQAWVNTRFTLQVAAGDVLGWARVSWLGLPLGVWAARRRPRAWPVLLAFPALVGVYLAYWVGAWVLGPRYYFEGLHSWLLATAWGWVEAWRWARGRPRGRRVGVRLGLAAALALLVALDLRYYLPSRLSMMRGLYGMTPRRVAVFFTPEAQALTPAWVRVQGVRRWNDYAVYVPLQDPWLSSPWVFVIDPADDPQALATLRQTFRGRAEVLFDPQQPHRLTVVVTAPR